LTHPHPPRRHLLAALLLPALLLAACDVQHSTESSPSPSPTPAISQAPEQPASSSTVTIHYHRPDADYTGVGLWTWDAYQKHTPARNELFPIGQDDFGPIFQLDRTAYADSDKIGLLPRFNSDWSRKDPPDRILTPAMGATVWLLSGDSTPYTQVPDLAPHLKAAFADSPTLAVLQFSQPLPSGALQSLHIRAEDNVEIPVRQSDYDPINARARVATASPLDFAAHTYTVTVDSAPPARPLVPRDVLSDATLYSSPDTTLGAIYSPASTTFRLFAPTAQSVSLILYNGPAGPDGRSATPMRATGKGIWEATIPGDLQGKFYMLLPKGSGLPAHETLDPYATNTVNSSTRARITPQPLDIETKSPLPTAPLDKIIYEMHVRDFTISPTSGVQHPGLYLGWTQPGATLPGRPDIKTALDHLVELGITDVQIMPVQDFANNESTRAYNWGYITNSFLSPEGMFATNIADDSRVRELHALIAALHQRHIGVIMDVVYNHTSDTAPFNDIVPGYYYRHLPDGAPANGSACGNEFRTEAPMARKYMLDSLKYWVTQYGVDGFRFDLMALLDRDTMTAIATQLRAINPNIAIYGEPWTGGDSPLTSRTDKTALHQVPVGAFNDDFRNALKGLPDGPEPGFIQDGSHRDDLIQALQLSDWFSTPDQSINYMTCHDNLVLWDKLKLSMPGATEDLIKQTARLGYVVLLTSPGVPFMQGGEEFGRTKGGDNNSYQSPDSVNQIDWSLKAKNHDLFTFVRDLIALRKAHPLFRLHSRADIASRLTLLPSEPGLAYEINGAGIPGETWQRALVLLNPGDTTPLKITLPPGQWEAAIDPAGATMGHTMSGPFLLPPKSAYVLFQE
jgi:pullulanase